MSYARKCDRCGNLYEPPNDARELCVYRAGTSNVVKNVGGDMCPSCSAEFDKWWNKKQKAVSK